MVSKAVYSNNPLRSSSTYIVSFSSLAFSNTSFILNLGKKKHSEMRNSSTQIKLTSQCLMDGQARKHDQAKLSLCSQIISMATLCLSPLWGHLCRYFWMIRPDPTFPAYQPLRKTSQGMHIVGFSCGKSTNSFEWKWLKEFWIPVGKTTAFYRCWMYLCLLLWNNWKILLNDEHIW